MYDPTGLDDLTKLIAEGDYRLVEMTRKQARELQFVVMSKDDPADKLEATFDFAQREADIPGKVSIIVIQINGGDA